MAMDASKTLWKSTEDALNSLGKLAMQTLAWQMNKKGFEMAPDSFDINKFSALLGDLLGEGAEPIINLVYKNLCEHLKADVDTDPSLPALYRINKILETKMN
jgi:hypothetical protein